MGTRKRIRKGKAQSYSVRVKSGNRKKGQNSKKAVNNSAMDKKKTLIANYKILGVSLDPNQIVGGEAAPIKHQPQELEEVETVDAEFLKQLVERASVVKPQKPKKNVLPLEEYLAIQKLLKKYKEDDLEKMQKDRKLNTYCWTESQLTKKIKVFKNQIEEEEEEA